MPDSKIAHNFVRGITYNCVKYDATYAQYLNRIGELYSGLAINETTYKELKLKRFLGVMPCRGQ